MIFVNVELLSLTCIKTLWVETYTIVPFLKKSVTHGGHVTIGPIIPYVIEHQAQCSNIMFDGAWEERLLGTFDTNGGNYCILSLVMSLTLLLLMSTAISSCRLKANEPKIFFSPFYVYVRLGGVIKQPSGHNWSSRNVEIMEWSK